MILKWTQSTMLFLLPVLALGQADQVDSILALPEDSNKVFALADLGFYYRSIDLDSAILFGQRAIKLAEELQYSKGIAQAHNDISIAYMDLNEYEIANAHLETALAIRVQLKDSIGMAAVYSKLANINQEQFKLKEALAYNFKALPIFEKNGPPAHHATMLNNIGNLQNNLREYDEALRMHTGALKIREKIGHEYGIATSHGNLGNTYLYLQDTARSIGHYQKAIELFRALNSPEALSVQLHNLAGVMLSVGNADQALDLYQEAYDIRVGLKDRKGIASTMAGLGKAHTAIGNYKVARSFLLGSLEISRSIDTRNEIMSAYEMLYRLYAVMNKGDSAILFFEEFVALRDTVFSEDLSAQAAEMRTKYETEKKEKRILEQEVEISNQYIGMIALGGGILIVVLGGSFLLYSNKQREKQKINAAIIDQKEIGLKAMLHAQENERRRIARELHDSVGQTLSAVKMAWQGLMVDLKGMSVEQEQKMGHTTKLLDEASTEVRTISHEMMPRALQEAGLAPALQDLLDSALGQSSIKYIFEQHNAETRFSEEVEIGIFRVCQELLNNIIKHSGASEVSVQLIRSGKNLVLIVEDNGKGFGPQDTKEGIGLLNIRSRIETVHGEVNFEPSPGSGTVATIRVPVA